MLDEDVYIKQVSTFKELESVELLDLTFSFDTSEVTLGRVHTDAVRFGLNHHTFEDYLRSLLAKRLYCCNIYIWSLSCIKSL